MFACALVDERLCGVGAHPWFAVWWLLLTPGPFAGTPRMSYYDLNDILAEETRTAVVLRTGILGLGYLEPGNPKNDLAPGTKLQLPLWMSQVGTRLATECAAC